MTSPQTCPLCGEPNGCTVAACGSVEAPCWCRSVVFSGDVLARVPDPARGLACICARCAIKSAADAAEPVVSGAVLPH